MRILVVCAAPFPAGRGSQLLVERTTRGLLARGHEVRVVVPRFGETGRSSPFPLLRAGLPRLGRRIDSRPGLLRATDDALLAWASLRPRADVIVGHNVEGGLIAGLAGRVLAIPSVYVRHSAFAEELALVSHHDWLADKLGRTAERGAERLASETIQLAPHPPRPGERAPVWLPPPADPNERPIEPGRGNVLYYEGNLDPYQNPAWLEQALEAARAKDPSVRLLRGRTPHDRPRVADLALVPRSLPGGFPMKLLAYQLAGIPAVCVESGAPGTVDGEDAFVVPGHGSPEAFAARVTGALADAPARARVRERARERALRRHDPERVAEMFESVLVGVVGRKR